MSSSYKKIEIRTFPTLDVVAAAVIAYRRNGKKIEKYSSASSKDKLIPSIVSNKDIMIKIINAPNQIKQSDRDEARAVIQQIQGIVTMNLLAGKKVSDFTKELAKEFENESSTEYKVGLLAYAPQVYEGSKERQEVDEKISVATYTSEALGKVGDKVRVNFTLITKKYVQSINCYSATGTDEKGNLIQFLTGKGELCQSQELEGKIKTVGASQYHHGAIVTGLNFVKVPKK